MDAPVTVIREAAWIVAWDEEAGCHCYRRNGDVAFAGNEIVQVGDHYAGPAALEVPGRDVMVMPGLIDLHAHPMSEPMTKGFAEDVGNPRLGWSGLYDYMPAYSPDEAGMRACAQAAYGELLSSGVTTLVDLSVPYEGWIDLAAQSGLRCILAPMFRSARWYTDNGHAVSYEWAEDGGRAAMQAALDVVDRALGHPSGRLSAMVTPAQVDTCTPALLRDAQAAARERGVPLHIHAAQSVVEFHEITRRHGCTPIQWLHSLGLLGAETIVAHAIFLDDHSWILWGEPKRDLAVLADSGVSVAHCPNVFVRHGMVLESFARYRAAGVNLGLGTDTFPHNLVEEMRLAALLGRIAPRSLDGARTADVFAAATVGGARALHRNDLGRLVPGAKADVVLVDLTHPAMRPVRDPLRSRIFGAAERAVRDVYVDGRQVVAGGRVLTVDRDAALDGVDAARLRAARNVPRRDWARRSLDTLSPLALRLHPSAEESQ
ncbi:MAG: N-ethylammeline chlorohydrolase [Alphaproteobacteria bacterium]|nr:MAG: N-ethylammeline chlorohydrolase [Alphaproteobacteria bacterium]